MPPSDCKLIRPTDEPVAAKIDFDWCQTTAEATTRRAELRRQKWIIRRRELELIASKNYLLPRLDAVGRYRWRGFGDDLFPTDPVPAAPNERFDNAYGDMTSGAFQEWQLGFELNVPIGFREGHVTERNAELQLSRERAILRDQQREIMHEVADAVSEVDRAYAVLQTSYNRLGANRDQLGAVQAAYEADKAPLDLYLDAQRRVADAETDYYLNRTRYTLASKNVHFVKGTLLDYDGVQLAEGPWPGEAYVDAAKREASRSKPVPLNYASSRAPIVSQGAFDQHPGSSCTTDAAGAAPVQAEAAPGTLPSEGALPITAPSAQGSGAAPNKPALAQPEVVQASATEVTGKKTYPVIGAGHGDPVDVPKIALRTGATPESATPSPAEPAVPRRLPEVDKP